MTLTDITTRLDELLAVGAFEDTSNHGLQVEAGAEVERVAFAVDACRAAFEAAARADCQLLCVHHGLSWGSNLKRLTGVAAQRIGLLFREGISLYAAHLPLDAHPEYGHNAVIARRLGLDHIQPFGRYAGQEIGFQGTLPQPLPLADLVETVETALACSCQVEGTTGEPSVRSLGIVSGGGGELVLEAAAAGLDAFLTGEIAHQHLHAIRETGLPVIAAGHYKTEVPGLEALERVVADEFGLDCHFIDLPTGR